MEKNKTNDMTTARLLVCQDRDLSYPLELLKERMEADAGKTENNFFILTRLSIKLYQEKRLKESLDVLIEALENDPYNISLNQFLRDHLNYLNRLIEEMSAQEEGGTQMIEIYELIRDQGMVSQNVHLFAAEQYISIGEKEKAKRIIESLKVIAPNLIGLKTLEEKV